MALLTEESSVVAVARTLDKDAKTSDAEATTLEIDARALVSMLTGVDVIIAPVSYTHLTLPTIYSV